MSAVLQESEFIFDIPHGPRTHLSREPKSMVVRVNLSKVKPQKSCEPFVNGMVNIATLATPTATTAIRHLIPCEPNFSNDTLARLTNGPTSVLLLI